MKEAEWYAEYLQKNSSKDKPYISQQDHERYEEYSWNQPPPKNAKAGKDREVAGRNYTNVDFIKPELLLAYDEAVDNKTGKASPDATYQEF